MIAIVILSVALLSMASTTVMVIKGNQISDRVTEATVKAQDTIEFLRNQNYFLGADMSPGTADDTSANELLDSSDYDLGADATAETSDDITLSSDNNGNEISDLFEFPDHAYAIDADGNEDTTNLLNSPTLTTSPSYLRRGWVIKDNIPVVGMKTITVVVGWREAGLNRNIVISTVIAGTRYSGEPGTI
ncbi:MAG: hypothetical protein A2W77_06605 [Nitrospinae bacterium RIFCSPLOWO2_12_39_16]|nr:MAG: hypothetical protein A2W77_06605 [Nitrospinae bacterium RIFCSPLOWO2_12_39_16]